MVTKTCNGYTAWFDNLGVSYKMMAIDCDPLLRMLRRQVFASQQAITEDFLAGPFSEARVKAKLEAWRDQIAESIEDDSQLDSAHWHSSVDALLAGVPEFHRNVHLMMAGLIEE